MVVFGVPGMQEEDDKALLVFRRCIPLFSALGDPMRQNIVMELARVDALTVNQVTDRMPLSRPAISHHLKILKEAGLVSIDRQGTENYYSLVLDDALQTLRTLIETVEDTCV